MYPSFFLLLCCALFFCMWHRFATLPDACTDVFATNAKRGGDMITFVWDLLPVMRTNLLQLIPCLTMPAWVSHPEPIGNLFASIKQSPPSPPFHPRCEPLSRSVC